MSEPKLHQGDTSKVSNDGSSLKVCLTSGPIEGVSEHEIKIGSVCQKFMILGFQNTHEI